MVDVRDEHEREAALRDARARANRLVLVAFGALLCAPVGLYVIYAALREARRARSLGAPSHPALRTAVLLATAPLLCIAVAGGSLAWWIWHETHRPARVVVANGLEDAIELRSAGRRLGEIGPGELYALEVPEGPVELCASEVPSGELVGCTVQEVLFGDAWLWNPGSAGRFVDVTTYYSYDEGDHRPESVAVLQRAEWIEVSAFDAVLERPPEELRAGDTRLERRWVGWTFSEPVLLVVDNPYQVVLAVTIDGALRGEHAPGSARAYYLREGEHHVSLADGERVLFDHTATFGDHGSYLLDPSGETAYQLCNEEYPQNGGVTYRGQPIDPAQVHTLDRVDAVLGAESAWAYWRPTAHWVEWAGAPCGQGVGLADEGEPGGVEQGSP